MLNNAPKPLDMPFLELIQVPHKTIYEESGL